MLSETIYYIILFIEYGIKRINIIENDKESVIIRIQ